MSPDTPEIESGVLFIGEKGALFADYYEYKLLPETEFEGFVPPEPTIAPSIGHHQEWIEACKHGTSTLCEFQYSGVLTEAVLLGNVAFRTGKKLEWNAAALKVPNVPEAERFLRREYRKGWTTS